MAYSVRVERVCKSGLPFGVPWVYEAGSEADALVVATAQVDSHGANSQYVASVFDPSGALVFAYVGRAQGKSHPKRV